MRSGKLGKTPTQFSGITPASWNIEELLNEWNADEKIEFLTYFERDAWVFGIKVGLSLGLVIGLILGILVAYYMF